LTPSHFSVILLKTRKKQNPTQAWMMQLPIKARKLERRLYASALSLDAYNDRTTLKKRLLALAHVIAEQHRESRNFESTVAKVKNQPRFSARSSLHMGTNRGRGFSVTSQSSLESSSMTSQNHYNMINRSSIESTNSIDSLRDLRESIDNKAVIDSASTTISENSRTENATEKKRRNASDAMKMPAPRQRAKSVNVPGGGNASTSNSAPCGRSSSFTIPHLTSNDSLARLDNVVDTSITLNHHPQPPKSMNEQLQQQILVNLRLQEEIVRKIQQADEQLLSNTTSQQAQHHDPVSMSIANDFRSNANDTLGGYNYNSTNVQPSAIMPPSSAINAIGSSIPQMSASTSSMMNMGGVSNQLPFIQQQQQQQYSGYNNTSNNNTSTVLPHLHQQQHQATFLSNNSNNMFNGVDSSQHQMLLQQHQQQASALSFGGVGTQFQQNQYNALLQQQQQLASLHASMSSNHDMGMRQQSQAAFLAQQQQQQLLQNYPSNAQQIFQQQQQQQAAMQMQMQNRAPSALSNVSTSQMQQLNAFSRNSHMTSTSVISPPTQQQNVVSDNSQMVQMTSTTGIQQPSLTEPSLPTESDQQPLQLTTNPSVPENLDDSSLFAPIDTFDWWK
jgi:hypothetical protein